MINFTKIILLTTLTLADPNPDTSTLDKSDFKLIQQRQIGLSSKNVPSITHSLINREIAVNFPKRHQMAHHFGINDRCKLSSRFIPSNKWKKTMEQYPSKGILLFVVKIYDLNEYIYFFIYLVSFLWFLLKKWPSFLISLSGHEH